MASEHSTGGPVPQLLRSLAAFLRPPLPRTTTQVLVVVEGPNDIEFLRRISTILHREDPHIPDLADMERKDAWSLCLLAALTYRPASALPAWACPSFTCWIETFHQRRRPASKSRLSSTHGHGAVQSSRRNATWRTTSIPRQSSKPAAFQSSLPTKTTCQT